MSEHREGEAPDDEAPEDEARPQGGRDLAAPSDDEPVDLAAAPGTEEHDRAQEAVMREGAGAAATETPGPATGEGLAEGAERSDGGATGV